ncbi:hypothetical protein M413DRAFT_114442 [Hebeloma cylindrosporum]|uniref:Uncharacterized protein n=1 Tax=Hebeloma cylindrosporum TaxID=76867 RepID=A0A0C2Z981_HEBCY|nr:hypothetical protein M413DRAFT_114442 [Hebeloma cylindrosporum h7]
MKKLRALANEKRTANRRLHPNPTCQRNTKYQERICSELLVIEFTASRRAPLKPYLVKFGVNNLHDSLEGPTGRYQCEKDLGRRNQDDGPRCPLGQVATVPGPEDFRLPTPRSCRAERPFRTLPVEGTAS